MVYFFNRGHIIVGTPGRLEDLFARKKDGLDLAAHVRSLVCTTAIRFTCSVSMRLASIIDQSPLLTVFYE